MKQKDAFSSEIVKEIEGIGAKYGKILAERAGIRTLSDFRQAEIERLSRATGINTRRLSNWKAAAVLRQIVGIDRQIAEVLVKNDIKDLIELRNANPIKIIEAIRAAREPREHYNIIPDTYKKVVTIAKVLMWQRSVAGNYFARGGFGAPAGSSGASYVNIWIEREYETKFSTLGSLFIAGNRCYTLEPPDRNNAATNNYLTAGRIYPGGYSSFVRTDGTLGWRMELRNVPGRSDIQIHTGNFYKDTIGCILPGRRSDKDTRWGDCVRDSRDALEDVRKEIESAGAKPDIMVGVSGIPQKIDEPPPPPPSNPPSSGGGW